MVATGKVDVIEWTKPPIPVNHQECQTDAKPLAETHAQTEILTYTESSQQTIEKELIESECQTEVEVSDQEMQTVPPSLASTETNTVIKEFKEAPMQSEYYQLFTASDV